VKFKRRSNSVKFIFDILLNNSFKSLKFLSSFLFLHHLLILLFDFVIFSLNLRWASMNSFRAPGYRCAVTQIQFCRVVDKSLVERVSFDHTYVFMVAFILTTFYLQANSIELVSFCKVKHRILIS
jgi:hypothetical protein